MKDWPKKHDKYITEFKRIVDEVDWAHENGVAEPVEAPHNNASFDKYLSWLGQRTPLKLLSMAYNPDDVFNMADPDDINLAELPYNKNLREHCQRRELEPVVNFLVSDSFLARTSIN